MLIETAKRIVDTLTVSKDFAKVGLIILGETAKSEFFFKNNYSKAALLERIGQLPYHVSKVSPAAAIHHAREIQFIPVSGDRQFAPDLLIFLTDETRALALAEVVTEIRQAALDGITVYSIGTDALNTLDLTSSVVADISVDQLLSTATHFGSVERTLATMTCSSDFGGSPAQYPGMLVPICFPASYPS